MPRIRKFDRENKMNCIQNQERFKKGNLKLKSAKLSIQI